MYTNTFIYTHKCIHSYTHALGLASRCHVQHSPILWFPGSTVDRDITVTPSDVNYTVILIVRPLALVVTFLTAYAVRFFYPNVFCYEWTGHVGTMRLSHWRWSPKTSSAPPVPWKLHWAFLTFCTSQHFSLILRPNNLSPRSCTMFHKNALCFFSARKASFVATFSPIKFQLKTFTKILLQLGVCSLLVSWGITLVLNSAKYIHTPHQGYGNGKNETLEWNYDSWAFSVGSSQSYFQHATFVHFKQFIDTKQWC